jgi:hypothetical protein
MHFHLAHIVPAKSLHGLHGYKDVIDTLAWGLAELGHTVSYGLNELSTQGRNIVFGVQMLDPSLLDQLPDDTIVYNFEQGRNLPPEKIRPQLKIAARRFEIWDYTEANMPMWRQLGALRAEVVPVGYAPVLQRIRRADPQDIDVLIYGVPGTGRLNAFSTLCQHGLTCLFACGLYGQARDDLIARSKVVLNVTLYERSKIFEIVRVSYLMANRKAVVAVVDADTVIDPDISLGVRAVASSDLLATCRKLVDDDAARRELEEAAFATFSRRDIREILAEVVDS